MAKSGRLDDEVSCFNGWVRNPLRFLLYRGNRNDICMAQALLKTFDLNDKIIIADKGYDRDNFVRWIEQRGDIAVIPSQISAKTPMNIDRHTYTERHLVDKLFFKFKNNRRLPPDMIRRLAFPTPLLVLLASLFGYFDSFKTLSRRCLTNVKRFNFV